MVALRIGTTRHRWRLAVVPHGLGGDLPVDQVGATGAEYVRLRSGVVDGQPLRAIGGLTVLGPGVARGGDHGLPLRGHAGEDAVLGLGVAGGVEGLADAPAGGDHLGRVFTGYATEQIEGRSVAGLVGCLVDDDRGRGCVDRGQFDIEGSLARTLLWATHRAVHHCWRTVRTRRCRWSARFRYALRRTTGRAQSQKPAASSCNHRPSKQSVLRRRRPGARPCAGTGHGHPRSPRRPHHSAPATTWTARA